MLGPEFLCLSLSNSLLLHLCFLYYIPPALFPFFSLPICSFHLFNLLFNFSNCWCCTWNLSRLCSEFPLFFLFRMYENFNKPLRKYLYGKTIVADTIAIKSTKCLPSRRWFAKQGQLEDLIFLMCNSHWRNHQLSMLTRRLQSLGPRSGKLETGTDFCSNNIIVS
jgi:hypothetical protein